MSLLLSKWMWCEQNYETQNPILSREHAKKKLKELVKDYVAEYLEMTQQGQNNMEKPL